MAGQNAKGGSGGGGAGIRAGRAFVEMYLNDNAMIRSLDKLKARFHSFGSSLLKIGGGIAGLGTAVLAPLAAVFGETIDHLDKINKASDRLGAPAETISALGYAAEQSGSDLEQLELNLKKMQQAIAGGGGVFKKLGLDAKELLDLPIDEQLEAIAEALAGVDNPAERAALAMEIFGKSGTQILPLLKDGAAGIRALKKEAGEVGAIVNGEDAAKGTRAGDALAATWTSIKNTIRAVGASFLPLIDQLETYSKLVIKGAGMVREFIAANRQAIFIVAAVAAGLVVAGAAVATLGGAFMLIGAAIGGALTILAAVKVVLLAIISPIGLTVLAVVALGAGLAYLFSLTSAGRGFFGELLNGFLGLGETIRTVMGGLSNAFATGDLALAGAIAMAGLKVVVAEAFSWIERRWIKFKEFFVDGWHDALKLLRLAWIDLDAWFSDMFLQVAKGINKTIGTGILIMLNGLIRIIERLPDRVKRSLGLSGLVEELKMLQGAFGTGTFTEELERERKLNKKAADERKAAVEKVAAAEQAARNAARAEDKRKADEDLKRAKDELDQLNKKAEMNRNIAAGLKAFLGVAFPSSRQVGSTAALAESVRGGFGGANARQIFGFGDKSVQREQLDVQKEIRDGVQATNTAIKNLDGVDFA